MSASSDAVYDFSDYSSRSRLYPQGNAIDRKASPSSSGVGAPSLGQPSRLDAEARNGGIQRQISKFHDRVER
jgi:hypothetical protein